MGVNACTRSGPLDGSLSAGLHLSAGAITAGSPLQGGCFSVISMGPLTAGSFILETSQAFGVLQGSDTGFGPNQTHAHTQTCV